MDRRSSRGLESEVLAVHVCNLYLEMVLVWMRSTLRRSGGCFGDVLDGRDKEW